MQRDKDKRHSLSLLRKMHGIKFHQRFRIIFLFKSSSLYKIYNDDLSWNFSNLLESKNGNKTVDSAKNICHCSCASFFFLNYSYGKERRYEGIVRQFSIRRKNAHWSSRTNSIQCHIIYKQKLSSIWFYILTMRYIVMQNKKRKERQIPWIIISILS